MGDQVDITGELLDYVRRVSLRDDEILSDLRAETAALPAGQAMQVMPEEAQLLALLISVTKANQVLEIGTFTGYSTLCMARALPADGRLVTCDISEKWPTIASPYWERAKVADRITLLLSRVIDPTAQDPDTTAIRELNAILHNDDRVEICLLIMADGITLVHKKPAMLPSSPATI